MSVILAKLFPEAEIIGIDIAPVPETNQNQKPENVTYLQGDIRQLIESKDSKFQPGSFDFVCERLLVMAIKDWPEHISALAGLVKVGGWLECHEFSWRMYFPPGERPFASSGFVKAYKADTQAIGLNVDIGDDLADICRAYGHFGEVKEAVYECAPREREERPELKGLEGQFHALNHLLLGKVCGGRRSKKEVEELIEEIDVAWTKGLDGNERFHMFAVFGQRQ